VAFNHTDTKRFSHPLVGDPQARMPGPAGPRPGPLPARIHRDTGGASYRRLQLRSVGHRRAGTRRRRPAAPELPRPGRSRPHSRSPGPGLAHRFRRRPVRSGTLQLSAPGSGLCCAVPVAMAASRLSACSCRLPGSAKNRLPGSAKKTTAAPPSEPSPAPAACAGPARAPHERRTGPPARASLPAAGTEMAGARGPAT